VQKSNKSHYLHMALSFLALVLTVKLAHTVYFSTDLTRRSVWDDTYNFLMMSMVFELILLSFCTLIPYVHIKEKEGEFHAFTAWGMEFADMVTQIVLLQWYSRANPEATPWDLILKLYYAFFVIDLVVFVSGCTFMLTLLPAEHIRRFVAMHIIVIDILTDLPFFCISLAGRTYVGNVFITIDMAFKMALFVRAVLWVPFRLGKNRVRGRGAETPQRQVVHR